MRGPDTKARVRGYGREIFAAKLEELAAKIRSGELDGCRAQWRDTHGENFDDDGLAISGMETVTRTAWSEDGSGRVDYVTTVIEETGAR